jgi:NADH-quinone oxidoreductase subunit F
MDLKPLPQNASPEQRACIDAVINVSPASGGLRDVRSLRHLLLPCLHAANDRFGWIAPNALAYIAERLHIAPAEAYGVASFYAFFSLTERSPRALHVCDDIACKRKGADALCDKLRSSEVHRSPCLGLCDHAPAALAIEAGEIPYAQSVGAITHDRAMAWVNGEPLEEFNATVVHQTDHTALRLLARVGRVDARSLDEYRAHGGYLALRRAFELGSAWVIREVTDSGLSGRGGAAFPTGRKWEAVARASTRPRHVICNADESEPGTFKDRVLMEGDPYALIEAMTLAGFATGAEHGWIYLRAEYPLAKKRLLHAIGECRRKSLLGDNILGHGVRFDIEIRSGAGAYICGEETALLNSLEGYRGEPRTKPPFPVEHGLFGHASLIHNVETLMNVPWIVREGASAFRSVGTPQSTGTRLFCVSGSVVRPGVYELPFGVSLEAVIATAGGMTHGRTLRGVLLGGAAGVFAGPESLGLSLTLEDTRNAGLTLGSGVVMVFDTTDDMPAILTRIAAFFRHESCGQCVPCRVGTVRQQEIIARLASGNTLGSHHDELQRFRELSQCMRDASICGLGQTATSAIESAIVRLRIYDERNAP